MERDAQGCWMAMHGEMITGPDGTGQGVSVIIGPAQPGTVLPILAAAYGLTSREQDVIRGVFAGHSTRQIAARLHISAYTVQDHLKAIFSKVGVTSRGELIHHLALRYTSMSVPSPDITMNWGATASTWSGPRRSSVLEGPARRGAAGLNR